MGALADGFTVVYVGAAGEAVHFPVPADATVQQEGPFLAVMHQGAPLLIVPERRLCYLIRGQLGKVDS